MLPVASAKGTKCIVHVYFPGKENSKLNEPLRRVQFQLLKNSQVQINSKLNEKNCMITY